MITEYYGNDSYVVLPDEIEGEPVTILGDYAFSRNLSVEEIWMPLELKEVGRYAFYRCRNLRKLVLGNRLLDMGGGALTGCHLEEVEIYLQDGKKSCLKSIVEEMRYQMRIYLHAPEGGQEAKLLFPEHYEEAVENTPARNWKRIITGQADIIVSVFMTVNWTIENMMRCFIIRLRKTQRRRQWNWH